MEGFVQDPSSGAARRAEERVLLACARLPGDREAARELGSLASAPLDWTRLARLAIAHKVTPFLLLGLESLPPGPVPAQILEALRTHVAAHRERARELARELVELLAAFERSGVRAVPFKGPALAERACGDASLRLAGDLDLLVAKRDIPRVCAELAARGFREGTELKIGRTLTEAEHDWYRGYQGEYLFVREQDALAVEPHWAIAPRTLANPLDEPGMLERARPFPFQGRSLPGLSTEDLLLVLCVHASKHEWTELRSVTDVAGLLDREPDVDWPELLGRARALGSARMLLLGLALARDLAGSRLAPEAERALAEDPTALEMAAEVGARLFREDYAAPSVFRLSRFRTRMRERRADRVAYVLRTVFTPTIEHVTLVALPRPLRFLYYPLKLAADYVALPVRRRIGSG
jgi:hypothetical protein